MTGRDLGGRLAFTEPYRAKPTHKWEASPWWIQRGEVQADPGRLDANAL